MRDALADGRNVGRGAKRDSRAGGGVEDRNALAVSDGDVRATGVHGEYRRDLVYFFFWFLQALP